MTTTTLKAVAVAATSLLSLLAVTVAAGNEGHDNNPRVGRGMGGGLVKFMMVSVDS